ncbi:PREDICTED: uncharacterized protein LOC108381216, partial [Rhagoletis zephyria]|uniref:uncharacterized protein LOC108381216 n=1 Tax=Rhagoletis zephyria TaxID=28612 RepID=UPI000811660C
MASAIIRSVAVHPRSTAIQFTDCICIDNGVASANSSPYRPTQLPPVTPYKPPEINDESLGFSYSKTNTPLCACVNCTKKVSSFGFDRFQSDIISTSTTNTTLVEVEKEKLATNDDHLSPIVEHTSVQEDAAALGALSKKQSPLFGRKKHNDSPTTLLSQSFSLRTVQPFYGSEEPKQAINQNKIDHSAVEAIKMSLRRANGIAKSPTNGTDINRNNGQIGNG